MEPTNFGTGAAKLERYDHADYPGGVVVDPTPITAGQETTFFYNGLLAQSGADQVYLRIGFGPFDNWYDVRDLRMSKTAYGWVKTLEAPTNWDRLSFCFRDSANNWDNNGGANWSWAIHNGRMI
ncbi:MAG: carbohydrate-binding protein [Clostridia bacterium]|nr:carbohydrate-binding protein [Clostridia bacterium]MDQ7791574.1 carbohydrate-binding protein [Clostridia bacterium]